MDKRKISQLLRLFEAGKISREEVLLRLEKSQVENIGFANVDHQRTTRQGFPEVIFCRGKTAEQVEEIAGRLLAVSEKLLATHASETLFRRLRQKHPELHYHPQARCIHTALPEPSEKTRNKAGILTGGTSDLPVAEEAALTLRMMGHEPFCAIDVGVAGIHRLEKYWSQIGEAAILIVAAGMEGALPSVIGGLVDKPVIAVPTSVGYGIHLEGLTPLLAMLNSCASNVTVVNINNGFGAGFTAGMFLKQLLRFGEAHPQSTRSSNHPSESAKK